jgi:dolichol kinase
LPLRTVLAYAAIAAFAEGTAPANLDNLTVPLVMHFSIDRVQLWIDRIQQWLPS